MRAIESLINELNKLPGVGRKSATRLAFFLLNQNKATREALANAIIEVPDMVVRCKICKNLTLKDKNPCEICCDDRRDKNQIIVVATLQDLMAIEDSRFYKGSYHVLHGLISPINGVMPDDLSINELESRVKNFQFGEIILATPSNVDGETTAIYIKKILSKYPKIQISRIASGVPIGSDLEYVDKVTLSKAIENRF